MGLTSSYGTGAYAAAEAHRLYAPRLWRRDTRPIIYSHAYSFGAVTELAGSGWTGHRDLITNHGYYFLATDMGGTAHWGNPTSVSRMTDSCDFATAKYDTRDDKFLLLGASMGALTVLNFARAHAARVAAIVLEVPIIDLVAFYDEDRGGLASTISTAYGGAPPSTSDPSQNLGEIPDVPIHLFYHSDDSFSSVAANVAFAAGTPNTTTTNLGTGGHIVTDITASAINARFASYA